MNIPLNWKLRLSSGHLELLRPLSQEAKEGITMLGGVIDPETKREMISSLQWRKRIMCGGARAL